MFDGLLRILLTTKPSVVVPSAAAIAAAMTATSSSSSVSLSADSEKGRNEYTPGNGNGICGTDTDLRDYFIIQIYTGNAGAYEE